MKKPNSVDIFSYAYAIKIFGIYVLKWLLEEKYTQN